MNVPTVDEFADTTVMRSLRKVVNYIINSLVPGINDVQTTADTALSTAGDAQTTAENAQSTATTAQQTATSAQTTANANAAKIQEIITQFNIMVAYVGADSELVTGTAPQPISTE